METKWHKKLTLQLNWVKMTLQANFSDKKWLSQFILKEI